MFRFPAARAMMIQDPRTGQRNVEVLWLPSVKLAGSLQADGAVWLPCLGFVIEKPWL